MDVRRQDKQVNGDSSSNCILSSFEDTTRQRVHPNHSGRPILDPTGAPTSSRSISRSPPPPPDPIIIRYRECLKNHAASMGGVVLDGCGEFMPTGGEDALKCAACECHRNFHRKETDGESQILAAESQRTQHHAATVNSLFPPSQPQVSHHNRRYPGGFSSSAPVMMNFGGGGGVPAESSSEDLDILQGEGSMQRMKKRFRTKFSQEQKEKMMEFAERLGWKIQKQDDEQVHQFCLQVGVKRKIFKVWMHNNKQTLKKKHM